MVFVYSFLLLVRNYCDVSVLFPGVKHQISKGFHLQTGSKTIKAQVTSCSLFVIGSKKMNTTTVQWQKGTPSKAVLQALWIRMEYETLTSVLKSVSWCSWLTVDLESALPCCVWQSASTASRTRPLCKAEVFVKS